MNDFYKNYLKNGDTVYSKDLEKFLNHYTKTFKKKDVESLIDVLNDVQKYLRTILKKQHNKNKHFESEAANNYGSNFFSNIMNKVSTMFDNIFSLI